MRTTQGTDSEVERLSVLTAEVDGAVVALRAAMLELRKHVQETNALVTELEYALDTITDD